VTAPAGTATGPTVRSFWRDQRGSLALLGLLVLAGVVGASLRETGEGGRLDPSSFAPDGSRAVRELLEDEGVRVTRLVGTRGLDAAAAGGATVLVAVPELLTEADAELLADLPGPLVLVEAPGSVLSDAGVPVDVAGTLEVEERRPACSLPAAERAGTVLLGGLRYRSTDPGAIACYAEGGAGTLLVTGRTAVLGSGDLLTNAELDQEGDAALALGLLGTRDELVWVVPGPSAQPETGRSLWSQLDDGWRTAALGLALAALVLALTRGRRLGRVVTEPLPVVVRAAEAVEGRGRLYRAAQARGPAAEALRSGARERLRRRLGLAPSADRAGLVATAAERTGREAGAVDLLLYGPPPVDDAALVRLADDLDTLTREVAGS
jgi:hypothetical protein